MGKRQKRIFNPQLLQNKDAFLGQMVNVVLTDSSTLHGRATALSETQLQVHDMRQRLHRLDLKQIAELVIDFEAAY